MHQAVINSSNIRKEGGCPRRFSWLQTSKQYSYKGVQRYQCKTCKRTFAVTKRTVFYGSHHSQQTILDGLAMLADRQSLAAIHRIKGVKEETVCEWLQRV